jgi:hypothetical protein
LLDARPHWNLASQQRGSVVRAAKVSKMKSIHSVH